MFFNTESLTMKWLIVLNILFINIAFSNEKEDEEKFKKEAPEIYRSVKINKLVPYEAFLKAYIAYFKYRNRLNNTPIITFVNYSIPSTQQRLVTVNFQDKNIIYISHASHGRNSSSEGGRACTRNTSVNFDGSQIPACPSIHGVPAVAFSTEGHSLQSSLGMVIVSGAHHGSAGFTKYHPKSLTLMGLDKTNSEMESHGVVFHDGNYVAEGGTSFGCIAVPKETFNKGYEILKNNTLLFAFEGSNFSPNGEGNAYADASLKEAIESSKDKNFVAPPDTSGITKDNPSFAELDLSLAPPSIGARALGIQPVGGSGVTAPPPELLKGSTPFEDCQNLSNLSWPDTVKLVNSSANPAEVFKGSWSELHQTAKNESIEDYDSMQLGKARVTTINKCVAMAHLEHADYKKPSLNQPDKKTSSDGSITCVYQGAESQDYSACTKAIDKNEALLKNEAEVHAKQESDFKDSSNTRVAQVIGDTAQSSALNEASGLQADHSKIALARAELSKQKIDQLAAVASQIPTVDSLYDECKDKFAKHGTVAIDDYNQFAKVYMKRPEPFEGERDYCLDAVKNGSNPIHNQKAREEIKKVLKKYGRDMDEYTSKSSSLLNRSTQTPTLSDSSFGMALTDLNMKNSLSTSSRDGVNGADQDDSMLLVNGNQKMSGSNGLGAYLERTNGLGTQSSRFNGVSVSGNRGSQLGGLDSSTAYKGPAEVAGSTYGSSYGKGGIYDEDFYRKINTALDHPEKLASLNLSPAEMQEYNTRKAYKELMAKGANDVGARAPASGVNEIKDESLQGISSKEQNLFEIISSRYAKKFVNGL